MNPVHVLFLLVTATLAQDPFCPGPPSAGCTNGMFSDSKCSCICLPPFCPDSSGDCTQPVGSCGEDQIQPGGCTRGVNCPWWKNALKAESCTTGTTVPAGMWNIYASLSDCCAVNFPFSEVCNVAKGTESPTKHPTIAAVEETPFETVPLLFKVEGLPDDVNMRALKDEMKLVLTAILSMISDSVPDMKLSSIDERDARRRLGESLATTVETTNNNAGSGRELLRSVEMYYDVNLIRVEGTHFGPIIIQSLKEAMSDVQNRIETTKTQYLDGDINVNFCTLASGKYTLCTSTPEPVVRPPQATTMSAEEPEG
eukprot:scaffold298543_cov146-Cyclotella_meneghiniana.AAC.1